MNFSKLPKLDRCLRSLVLIAMFFTSTGYGSPQTLTYQGRILKSDGTPLNFNSVSFIFKVTDPTGACVIYQEQVNGYDMTNANGVFDVPIGAGSVSYPNDGSLTLLDAFNNSRTYTCSGGSTYSAGVSDTRKLRVQFFDGSGWQTISPDSIIRSVPFAGYSLSAQKLGTYSATDFLIKTGLPLCTANTFLTWDGSQLTCGTASTATGSVTEVSSANTDIGVATGTTTPILTLNVGTGANQIPKLDGSGKLSSSVLPSSTLTTASTLTGDVSGTVSSTSVDKLKGTALAISSLASGNVLKYNGTNWINAALSSADLSDAGSLLKSSQMPANCTANQTLTFSSPTGSWTCSNITVTAASFGSQAANTFLAAPSSSSGTATFRSLTAADLPAGILTGAGTFGYVPYYNSSSTLTSSNIFQSGSNVGIGTASPAQMLTVAGTIQSTTGGFKFPDGTTQTTAASAVSGTSGYLAKFSGSGLANSLVQESGSIVSVGITPDAYNLASASLRTNNIQMGNTSNFSNQDYYLLAGANSTTIPVANTYPYALISSTAYQNFNVVGVGGSADNNGNVAAAQRIVFFTNSTFNSTTYNERMRIESNGNVGIGATSPANALDIGNGGGIHIAAGTPSSTSAALYNVGGALYWNGVALGSGSSGFLNGGNSFAAAAILGTNDGNTLAFKTNGTNRMLIDTSGHVGIGTTSPGQMLSVAGTVESTSGGFKFPDGTTQTTAASGGLGSGQYIINSNTSYTGGRNVGFGGTSTFSFNASGAGTQNVGMGYYTFQNLSSGSSNVGIGDAAVPYLNTGSDNTAVGHNALYQNTAGNQNTVVGSGAGYGITGSNNIAIGYNAAVPNSANSNQISIGNLIYGVGSNVGIGNSNPGQKLSVAGTIESTTGGFKFPDGTTQATAAGGQWTTSGSNIYNANSGNVGVGTTNLAGIFTAVGRTDFGLGYTIANGNGAGGTTNAANIWSPTLETTSSYVPETALRVARSSDHSSRYSSTFDIQIGSYAGSYSASSQVNFVLANGNTYSPEVNVMSLLANGTVGIGTTSPSYSFHVANTSTSGAIAGFTNSAGTCSLTPSSSSATFSCTSDERLKKDIEAISGEDVLSRLMSLQAVTYALKKGDQGQRHTGYIAQKVQQIAPEFVTEGPDGLLQVSYTGFIPWITESIKELNSQRLNQARGIASVENENAQLKARVDKTEQDLASKNEEIRLLKMQNEAIAVRLERIEKSLNSK